MTNMFWQRLFLCLITLCFLPTFSFASKQIAITIDDLPFVGECRNFHLNMIMQALQSEHVTATGFVIGKEVHKNNWDVLQQFRDAGFGLGNHTFSHANLNKMNSRQYIQEIQQADTLLKTIQTSPKYFRFPYLAMGHGRKKEVILSYLRKKHYRVAPITIDSKDFVFNQRLLSIPEIDRRKYLTQLKAFYLEFIWTQTLKGEANSRNPDRAQILLIHANLLNAYVLPDIIQLFKQKGYVFVSLEEALATFDKGSHPIQSIKKTRSLAANDAEIEAFMEWD